MEGSFINDSHQTKHVFNERGVKFLMEVGFVYQSLDIDYGSCDIFGKENQKYIEAVCYELRKRMEMSNFSAVEQLDMDRGKLF